MIRLTHLSGSLQGTSSTSPKAVIRIGRGADCDVRFDPRVDTRVSSHHAEIRFEAGHYSVVDIGSSNGTLVNGKLVRSQKLRSGDKIVFGAQGGPEVRFEIDVTPMAMPAPRINGGHVPQRAMQVPMPQAGYGLPPPRRAPPPNLGADADVLAREAQQKIAQARAMSGGQPSGQTMFIMADTMKKVEQVTHKRDSKKTVKIVLAIQLEGDPEKLQALEDQLTALTGKAQQTIGELEQKDKAEAAKVENQGDELDRAIRRILRKFEADTYAVPPIFKQRLQHYIEQKTQNRALLRQVYARRQQFWPIISREFSALGLPEEIAYVAWQESNFDPYAQSAAGARGMWQFMDFRAREFGMRVDANWRKGGHDDRTDVARSTKGAAKYLYNLLSEFGADSFMLAIASYNKGENGMRRLLHQVGFRKEQRDFWHLYRLKKLPEETMEYVPQILAAAIISNDPKKYGLESQP